jgi:hypothetical protein
LSDNKETNREIVARLFNKRTGVVYQNWIQAWSVTEKQIRKIRAELPKLNREKVDRELKILLLDLQLLANDLRSINKKEKDED